MQQKFVKYHKFILTALFFLGLTALPLIFWPWAAIPYEIPRVWFVQRWLEILGIIGFLGIFSSLAKTPRNFNLIKIVIVFLILVIISSILGSDFQKSLMGNYYRGDGLLTLFHLIGLFFFTIVYYQKSWPLLTVISVTIGGFIVSLITLIDAVRLFILNDQSLNAWGGALGATFGQPKFLTGYLLVTLPLTAAGYHLVRKKWKLIFLFVGVFQILAIFFTRSWAGVMGIVIFAVISIVLFQNLRPRQMIYIGILSIFMAILVASYIVHQEQKLLSTERRGRIFSTLIVSIQERPLIGWGWANVDHAFRAYVWPVDVYIDKAHSHLLEILTTGGSFGLSAYLVLLFAIGKILWSKRNMIWYRWLFVSFVIYILHTQTNVTSIAEEVIFWYLAGIAAQT